MIITTTKRVHHPSGPWRAGTVTSGDCGSFVKVTEPVQLNVVVDVREEAVPAPAPPPIAECPPSMRFHVVQPGESLWSIAQRYGVSMELNGPANPRLSIRNYCIRDKRCVFLPR